MGNAVQTGPILKSSGGWGQEEKTNNIKLIIDICTLIRMKKQMGGRLILTVTLVWFRVAGGGNVTQARLI